MWFRLCKANVERRRKSKAISSRRVQTLMQILERQVGKMRTQVGTNYQDQSYQDMSVPYEGLGHLC